MNTPVRRALALFCAAAAVPAGLVTLSVAAHAEPNPQPPASVPSAAPAEAGFRHPTTPLGPYLSRLDVVRPAFGTKPLAGAAAEGYFALQYAGYVDEGRTLLGAPVILDRNGALIWSGPVHKNPTGRLTPITFDGRPALTYQKDGVWQILDQSLRTVATVPGGPGDRDFTPLLAVDPTGTKALVTGARSQAADLSAHGGTATDTLAVSVIREIEIKTGKVLFTWDSWSSTTAGIPLSDTTYRFTQGGLRRYVDIKSVGYDSDGDIVFSGAGTDAAYKLRKADSTFAWILGGKSSTITLADGSPAIERPREVRRRPDGSLAVTVLRASTLMAKTYSFSVDEQARTASLATAIAPELRLEYEGIGAASLDLSNGNLYMATENGRAVEVDPAGNTVATGTSYPSGWVRQPSRANWVPTWPATVPDIALDMTSGTDLAVLASWNGASDVTSWRVSVGPDIANMRPLATAARTGFETRIVGAVNATDAKVRIEALDAAGNVMSTAPTATLGPVTRKYGAYGGSTSALGKPTSFVEPWQGGQRQHFVGGDIYWRADTGARVVLGRLATRMDYIGAAVGFPVADTVKDSRGYLFQLLTSGGMYSWGEYQDAWVTGGEWTKYSALNREKGPLGYPLADVLVQSDGTGEQLFQGGQMNRVLLGGRIKVTEVHGAIYTLWKQQGREGVPTTDEITTPDGVGRFNAFADRYGQYWSIYWTPGTGAHKVGGQYRDKWGATGWERGIGYPTSEVVPSSDLYANYQNFERGSIFPNGNGRDVHVVQGAIRDKYVQTGRNDGWLFGPLTDELVTPDGYGRFNQFHGGCIYWTPRTGAQALTLQTRDQWMYRGWELGWLGYPVTSTARTPDGIGEHTHFDRGSIYVAHRPYQGSYILVTGTVQGDIRAKYASLGWERSRLGYPRGDEQGYGPGKIVQWFERGQIIWEAKTRKTTVNYF